VPYTSAVLSPRWILIDRTCQVMFVGRGAEALDLVFPTSTGQPGYPTRPQDRTRAFRYNPVLHNGGWHNSTTYPVAADNALNGNMYKPLYFDGGQAIHGANNVPRSPASKGCARLRVGDQDRLVAWLGLADVDGPTNDPDRIAVTVNVQGDWRGN
jgi:lipoprotein-anchoring transpeptidase ErfK/SrfK